LTGLDLVAGVEPIGCLVIQNRQAVGSIGRSMDWTLENSIVELWRKTSNVNRKLFCNTVKRETNSTQNRISKPKFNETFVSKLNH